MARNRDEEQRTQVRPLAALEELLGHRFRHSEYIERALTHRSLANQLTLEASAEELPLIGDNERLEFLGDAVLGLVVGEALFAAHPEWREGELTRVRAQLVSRQHMTAVAQKIQLGEFLRLSRGEERSGLRAKATVLSNSMEAVLGAIYLDGGLGPVQAFAQRWILGEDAAQLVRELQSGAALGNYKSALQERLQAERAGSPVYRLKGESGPDHRKRFVVEAALASPGGAAIVLAEGAGSTKKLAEQDAARCALAKLDAQAAREAEQG